MKPSGLNVCFSSDPHFLFSEMFHVFYVFDVGSFFFPLCNSRNPVGLIAQILESFFNGPRPVLYPT